MKHFYLILFIFFGLFFQETYARSAVNTPTPDYCYKKEYLIPAASINSKYFIAIIPKSDTPSYKKLANLRIENGTSSLTDYDLVDFTTNVNATIKNGDFYSELDTRNNKEIIISVDETLKKGSFIFNFSYQSLNHSPKYFINEGEDEKYFPVKKANISDFSPMNIKIVFEDNNAQKTQEVINITKLELVKKQYGLYVTHEDTTQDLRILGENTCYNSTSLNKVTENLQVSDYEQYEIVLEDNNSYILNTKDSDNDKVSDLNDNCLLIKNTDQKDINQNGVGDACEFDSDRDSVPDEIDNCRGVSNPGQEDDDKDGIGNSCDNCELYNPSQIDVDGNKIGDTCDRKKTFLENNDDDNDGILNSLDNCRNIANANQADDDNDRIGNSCDNCTLFQNYDQVDSNENGIGDICEDSDSDGVDSITDNCINIPNPDQADDDNDGIGNVCEDDDRDNVLFSDDNCPHLYNPNQLDTDGDKLGDKCDNDDDRFLESNKEIFILLMFLVMAGFGGAIFMMAKKLKK